MELSADELTEARRVIARCVSTRPPTSPLSHRGGALVRRAGQATIGWRTAAATPSPPTTRPTSSCACAAPTTTPPNANAVMISNLVALNLLTGKPEYLDRAHAIPSAFAADLGSNPLGHCGLLSGCFDLIAPQHVIVIQTADVAASAELARAMFNLSLPGAVQQSWPLPSFPSQAPSPAKPPRMANPPPTPAWARPARCPSRTPSRLPICFESSARSRRIRRQCKWAPEPEVRAPIEGIATLTSQRRYGQSRFSPENVVYRPVRHSKDRSSPRRRRAGHRNTAKGSSTGRCRRSRRSSSRAADDMPDPR